MTGRQILRRVELPLAMPLIFTGIRIAAVTIVATAPIAAIAGGGGLGDVIVNQASYRLSGVLGASLCVMALSAGVFVALAGIQIGVTPRGLRGTSVTGDHTERSSSDPQAHEASRQGGVRDFPRGRDRHRLVRGRLRAAGTRSHAGPTIVIGTKNFPEEYILGQLYKQALEAKGFTVSYKENIGSTELIQTALDERQDQLLSRVHGRDRAGRLPSHELAEDGRRDLPAGEAARGGEGLHACSTRRRSTTPT